MTRLRWLLLLLCLTEGITVCLAAHTPKGQPAHAPAPIMVKINAMDGATMVWVPAGEFLMGSAESDKYATENEKPQHKVSLDGFWIYKNDVTVAQYRKFCQATHRQMPELPVLAKDNQPAADQPKVDQSKDNQPKVEQPKDNPPTADQPTVDQVKDNQPVEDHSMDNYPMVDISWDDARAYAEWAGAALPNEAQWEKAARGTDGRIYPWGNEWDATKCCSRVGTSSREGFLNLLDPTTDTATTPPAGNPQTEHSDHAKPVAGQLNPAGSYPEGASPYGCLDMAGNVWQWCADWYHGGDYYQQAPTNNPLGAAPGLYRVVRGGSWGSAAVALCRSACRREYAPSSQNDRIGFRCVVHAPAP